MLKFEFTQQEIQTIGDALAELPYKVAAPLLNKIQMRINAIAEAESAKAATTEQTEE